MVAKDFQGTASVTGLVAVFGEWWIQSWAQVVLYEAHVARWLFVNIEDS